MNKKGAIMGKPRYWKSEVKTRWGIHTVYTSYNPQILYYNLWDLADEILEAGKITDDLFKRIGEALAKKIWFWESLGVKNEYS